MSSVMTQEQHNTEPSTTQTPSPEYLQGRAVAVLPTYDERDNVVDIIAAVLKEQVNVPHFELYVLIADGHSQDGTLDVARAAYPDDERVHLLDVNQRGIGAALYRGFHHAIDELGADILIEMDSDFQHNPEDIPLLLNKAAEGYDVVVGSRFLADSHNNMPFYRKILAYGANQVLRTALGLRGVTEITTSFRAIRKEAFLSIDESEVPWWEEKSFIAVPVFLVRMLKKGAKATEVPMTMHPRVRGYSKMIYWRYIRDVLWFSFQDRLGLNKKAATE